ncbi:aromatic amino acid transaminase [Streptomyces sp. TLI_105]|uniref:amino acid aminotransferase n=1 Tax=Streptomyces sp. TLI_105 TaxID=1881019 RepID=UPI000896282F|nr:aromatic amino acid transaminase [Streptomyces sp. TLI_105]SEB67222.1 aspartate aminotransferase [Streptomyces sp. TLI_105]
MLELLPAPPADPLWDLTAEYAADPRPERLDLVLGVYRDHTGVTPVMAAVKEAEMRLAERSGSKEYLGLSGNTAFNRAMLTTVLGTEALTARATAVQTVAGTGALRLLADLVRQTRPGTTVWISDPAYVNHRPILEGAGLTVRTYRWLDATGLLEDLREAGPGDVVLLQGCCHNPTGADPSPETWEELAGLAATNGWVPFVDLAYHGLGDGLDADLRPTRMLAERLPEVLIAVSCSKNFGLYSDRTGCAVVVGSSARALRHVETALQNAARTLYSMPPDHGAAVVATVLEDERLKAAWLAELDAMRHRITANRTDLVAHLGALGHEEAASALGRQKGMFSMLPLTPEGMLRMRRRSGIYGTTAGRINIAGVPAHRIPFLARGIADALRAPAATGTV